MDLLRIASRVARKASSVRVGMTVGELIAELSKSDPNDQVSIRVEGPKDTAYTGNITEVKGGAIRGWAGSDDPDAWMPGSDD